MPLRFAITLILAVAGLAATAQSEERHYLLYLSSTTACPFPSGITNPANYQSVPGARPVLPPTSATLSQSFSRNLCFYNWNPTPQTTSPAAGICQPNPTVKGDEVCQQLLRFTAQGFTIQSFAPAAGFQSNLMGSTLNVIGGNLAGQVQTSLGTITLLGTAAGGTFRLQSGDYIESDAAKHLLSNVVIAQVASTCGNAVINAPEECDDGNTKSGDHCFRTCEREQAVTFSGTPTGVGAVTGSLSGVEKTVTTAGLSTASDIASAMANAFNTDPALNTQSIEVDPLGTAIYSDGTFGNFNSTDPTVNAVPEPAGALGLVSGAVFLAAIGRRRVRG